MTMNFCNWHQQQFWLKLGSISIVGVTFWCCCRDIKVIKEIHPSTAPNSCFDAPQLFASSHHGASFVVLHSIRALCQLLVLLLLLDATTVQTRIIAPKLGEDVFVVINLKISMVVVCTFVNLCPWYWQWSGRKLWVKGLKGNDITFSNDFNDSKNNLVCSFRSVSI